MLHLRDMEPLLVRFERAQKAWLRKQVKTRAFKSEAEAVREAVSLLMRYQQARNSMNIPRASSVAKVEAISTGLPQLDRAIGIGGIPIGRITEISGKWSAGKSTLALQIVKEAQAKGMECVWHDTEFTFDDSYARELGVDTEKLYLVQEITAEKGLDSILDALRGDETKKVKPVKNVLFIIDSVGGLHPAEEAGKSSGERTIGAQASLIARFCRKSVPYLAMNDNALIVLNHEYMEIGALRPTVMTAGGAKLSYHKALWIRLNRNGTNVHKTVDGEKTIIGYLAEAEIRKNKVSGNERKKCVLEMNYGQGFLASANLLQEAIDAGVIIRTGNTHYLGEEKLGNLNKVKDMMKDDVFAAKIREEIAG